MLWLEILKPPPNLGAISPWSKKRHFSYLLELQRGNSQQVRMLSIWGFKGPRLCSFHGQEWHTCRRWGVFNKTTIKEGIKNSTSALIVFSLNYVSLDELVLILERKNSSYFIIPLFFFRLKFAISNTSEEIMDSH